MTRITRILLCISGLTACTVSADPAEPASVSSAPVKVAPPSEVAAPLSVPLPEKVSVWSSPEDGSTNIGSQAIRIGLHGLRGKLGIPVVRELAAQVRLVTWPEREVVEATALVPPESSYEIGDLVEAAVTISPRSLLADRWYAVVVSDGKMRVGKRADVAMLQTVPGEIVTRFRRGSEPHVRQARRCGSDLVFTLSEIVSGDMPSLTIHSPTGAIACAPRVSDSLKPSDGVTEVRFACPGAPIVFTMDWPLTKSSGRLLKPGTTFNDAATVAFGECRMIPL